MSHVAQHPRTPWARTREAQHLRDVRSSRGSHSVSRLPARVLGRVYGPGSDCGPLAVGPAASCLLPGQNAALGGVALVGLCRPRRTLTALREPPPERSTRLYKAASRNDVAPHRPARAPHRGVSRGPSVDVQLGLTLGELETSAGRCDEHEFAAGDRSTHGANPLLTAAPQADGAETAPIHFTEATERRRPISESKLLTITLS
jgi:hypothetical protein